MSTSRKKQSSADPGRVAARDHDRYLQRHRRMLLRYLDAMAPKSAVDPDALDYVGRVLEEWHASFDTSELPDPQPEERAFWFALYQLELLAESPGPVVDPYEKVMLESLVEVRELLRQRRPLPDHRFMATRPNGR